jgi:peptidoglycan/LPS O-acetylase OafA/YrhL
MKYRREIDGLRALAVLPVMLFHAGFASFGGGFVGVDVFFVISGYLITTILLAELEQGRFSIVNFYERRARRILPALFVVMLACLPFAWWWLMPVFMRDFSASLVAVPLSVSNILFWQETGYFDTVAELKPLLHTWSLAVEEQYYLLFPLFLMLTWKLGKRWTGTLLALAGLASLSLAQWASAAKPAAGFFLLPTRGWELLIGAFAAFYLSRRVRPEPGRGVAEACGWLGLALISYPIFAYDMTTPFPGVYALAPTVGTLLVILFATERTTIGRIIGNRLFVGIGLISYSAYLWHQPLFAFYKHADGEGGKPAYLLLMLLTLGLAYLSWRYVELPFRDKTRFGRRTIFGLSGLMIAFFVAFGAAGYKTHGFENRPHMLIFKDLTVDVSALGYVPCEEYLRKHPPELGNCYGSGKAPTALVFGDSHAEDKFPGIEKSLPGYDWRLIGNSSCPPIRGVRLRSADGTECKEKLDKVFSYIDTQKTVRLVVLSFAHAYPLGTLIAADHIQRRFDPNSSIIQDLSHPEAGKIEAFYAGLERTIDFLEKRNIKTVILLDTPELTVFPADCLRGRRACGFSREAVLERQVLHRERILALARKYEGLKVFDPLDVFCTGDSCSLLKDGRPLFHDSHHLSHFGSYVYGTALADWNSRQDR